jgi:hypothetical protein
VVFVASWVIAGALESGPHPDQGEPGYSHIDQAVSELGALDASHGWIVGAGLVILGVSLVALAVALWQVLPSRLAAALFVAAGVAIVVSGLVPLDCRLSEARCEFLWRRGDLSWHTDGHLWAGLAAQLFLVATPFAVARALWPAPPALLAAWAGVFGLGVGLALHFLYGVDGAPDGLLQRISLLMVHVWVLIVAVGVLHATRREHAPGQLVRVRPRDFFAGEWAGTGALVGWPFFLWRRLARPFGARRHATWISENVWRFDDEADFGGGRVRRRRTYCEFVSSERVSVTAGDLPDGACVWIEEDGYRVVPFRMDFPIGPVGVPMRVHDVSWVEDDGTLVNAFEARSLVGGLPLARLSFRVRPVVRASGDGQAR